jgi:hypothetical protein
LRFERCAALPEAIWRCGADTSRKRLVHSDDSSAWAFRVELLAAGVKQFNLKTGLNAGEKPLVGLAGNGFVGTYWRFGIYRLPKTKHASALVFNAMWFMPAGFCAEKAELSAAATNSTMSGSAISSASINPLPSPSFYHYSGRSYRLEDFNHPVLCPQNNFQFQRISG